MTGDEHENMDDPRRRRVLSVIHVPSRMGGAERVAVDLALSLDRSRFVASFCQTKTSRLATREEEIRAEGLDYTTIGSSTMRSPVGFARFARLVRRERIDIVHSHMWDANLWSALASPLARSPIVVAHDHTWSFEGHPFRVATDRLVIARRASVMACVSEADRRKMIEIEHIPPDLIRVLPNGIAPLPHPSGADIRAEAGIPPDALVVGIVAVLREQKRHDVLLQAIARLRDDLPNVHLLIAGGDGGGTRQAALEQEAASLGIREYAHFLGRREDIADVLAACDVACLSSDYEGQPLAVMEYMAAGKPIVATTVGGVPELIDDGVEGLLVPRRDPAALADAVKRILVDREFGASLGAAANARQQREFSLTAAVARIESLYDELWEKRDHERRRNADR